VSELPPGAVERDLHKEFLIAHVCGHEFEPQPVQEVSESGRRDIYRCLGCGARVVLCYKRGSDQPFESWMEGKAARRCPAPPPRSEKPPATQELSVVGPDGVERVTGDRREYEELQRQTAALKDLRRALGAVNRLRRAARHCELAVALRGFSAEDLDSNEHDLDSAIAAFERAREEVRAVKRDRLRNPAGGEDA
jgi:hypothetical protein